MSKVDVILVRYNQPELEAATIKHVLDTAGPVSYGLVAHQNEPGVGLAKAWNRLIAASTAEYICLLNTDVIPARGWLSRLVRALDIHPEWAAIVPSSNRVHLSQVDGLPTMAPTVEGASRYQDRLEQTFKRLPTCSAMCVVFRREVWVRSRFPTDHPQVFGSGFDEDFQFYGEDTEFFYRIRAMGLGEIVWDQGTYVHHIGQQSFKKAVAQEGLDYPALRAAAMALWLKKKGEIDARYPDKALAA